jgi:molybdopterin molybdotransferase
MTHFPAEHPNADVRMRGFVDRISAQAALDWLEGELARRGPLGSETVTLESAVGRVLAEPVVSSVNVPNFPRAMVDGFALRAADIQDASTAHPVRIKVLGDCFPGAAFAGPVGVGQAVRIMTGAPLPAGVDAVLPVEQTQAVDAQVAAVACLPVGKHCGRIGEDVACGQEILAAGRVLRPQDVGLLAAIGHPHVAVVRQPRVRILVTGNELLPAGEQPRGCQIVDSNGPLLQALVRRDGGLPDHPGIVADARPAIAAALASDADLVITSGGSSVGQEDHVPTLLDELAVHGIAMRPGGPTGMGLFQEKLVLLLPGNPVACLWAYDWLARLAVQRLGGRPAAWPYRSGRVELASALRSKVGRLDYVRVQVVDGRAAPAAGGGASVLSSTTRSDGFVIVPSEVEGLAAGTEVELFYYDSLAAVVGPLG